MFERKVKHNTVFIELTKTIQNPADRKTYRHLSQVDSPAVAVGFSEEQVFKSSEKTGLF